MNIETIELIKVGDEKMIIVLRTQNEEVRIKGFLDSAACIEFDELKEEIRSMNDITE